MTTQIKTYKELVEEKKRLKGLLEVQKLRVTDDWTLVKHELEPVNSAFGLIGKMTKGNKSNPLVNVGLKLASETLLKNLVLARAGWLAKLAIPLLVKNYSSHLMAGEGRSLFQKLKTSGLAGIFKRKNDGNHHPVVTQ
jgi:hypothetical protein